MEFTFTDTFYVCEYDFDDMVAKVKNGDDIEKVIDNWATGLDDPEYYIVYNIENDLKEAILKKVKGE